MGMGMTDETATSPDTYGLQEFFITDVHTEIAGSNVRMTCGARRGGQVYWLYSCIMPADLLLAATQQCKAAAQEAFNITQLMDRRASH
jgi:hypothetical protein